MGTDGVDIGLGADWRYIEQGKQQGGAAVLLRLVERKFGPPSESVRELIASADPETLLITVTNYGVITVTVY